MERIVYILAVITSIATTQHSSAALQDFKAPVTPDFNHYNIILKRMPFGAPPAADAGEGGGISAAEAKNATQAMKEQQLLARQLNMSCVNVTPAGALAVGFSDLSVKPPVNYYLLVGDEADGWTLKSADYTEEWAELEKDDITIYVKLGQGLMAEPPERKVIAAKETIAQRAGDNVATEMPPQLPGTRNILQHRSNSIAERLAKMQDKDPEEISNVKSYMARLRERKLEEAKGRESEKEAARTQLEEMAREITKEELDKSQRETEISLLEQGVIPAEERQSEAENAPPIQ